MCRYDLSESSVWKCPECAHECSNEDRADYLARCDDVQRLPTLFKIQIVVGVSAACVLGSVAAIVARQLSTVVIAMAASVALLAFSWLGCWVVTRYVRAQDRDAWLVAWLRTHLWLHICWMCLPFCTAVIFLYAAMVKAKIAANDVAAGQASGDRLVLFALIGFLAWVILVIVTLIVWVRRWETTRARYRMLDRDADTYLTLFVMLLVGSGCVFAVWYGIFVTGTARGWLDPT